MELSKALENIDRCKCGASQKKVNLYQINCGDWLINCQVCGRSSGTYGDLKEAVIQWNERCAEKIV